MTLEMPHLLHCLSTLHTLDSRKFCLLLTAVNMIYKKCKPPSPRQKKKMTPQWVRNDSIHSTRKIMECSISGTEYLCCSKTYIIYCEKSLSNLQEC